MSYATNPLPLSETPVTWEVFLQKRTGQQVIPLSDLRPIRGHVYMALNGLGSFSLELPLDKLAEKGYTDIPDDMMLEFVRKHGVTRSFSFYKRKTVRTRDTLTIAGFGLNHLLKRRIIAYFAESAQAKKTDYLDDMMKAIVRENLGENAEHFETGAKETNRSFSTVMDFTVADDLSLAPSDTMAFSMDNCYDALLKIAANSTQQGTRLFFEIVRTGTEAFEFVTYTDARGEDRRDSQTFGQAFGNLTDTEYMRDAGNEATYIYVAGRGEANARAIEEVARDTDLDPFSRLEVAYNATTTPDNALAALGYDQLRKRRALETFDGKLVSNENAYYGVDWDLGDLLDAKDGANEFSIMVTGIEMYYGKPGVTGRFEVLDEE